MDLFLVRHAIAAPARPELADADRRVTPRGRRRFRRSVRGLGRLDVRVDRVLHGPALRALDTAELLSPLLTGERELTELLARSPGPALLALLDGARVAAVGHQPWLSELMALLVSGSAVTPHIRWKKGGVAWLSGEARPGGMVLRGLYAPRVLAAIGR